MAAYVSRTGVLIPEGTEDAPGLAPVTEVLAGVNGRAAKHTFDAKEIVRVARRAEYVLEERNFLERERVGAEIEARSGGPTASSYNGSFVCTLVTLVRRADGWHLTSAKTLSRYAGKGAGTVSRISVSHSAAAAVQNRALAGIKVREPKRRLSVAEAA
ncbi:hypothetical protein [Aurantimonas sp. HBX-1]|uniref:hypothetical protein n=1 Tax=Aurantimonas sp. HBX-1 TaxID=2906072 RepID=UPI001F45E3CB|nr:hypothetical protein [Aurantimonas sp. HBX-1]UIJ73473.1 hypothetical protein LXB15_07525 [Aurantimonas sp. HBX-1]